MDNRTNLLKQISECSFVVNDLTLFLDTHPKDQEALAMMKQYHQQRKTLMKQFEEQFEPLTVDCICSGADQPVFTWTLGPAPWEGGAN